MQKDMHYFGTYALARAAGLNREASKSIATCSQFVDDNADKYRMNFVSGACFDSTASAHHSADIANLDEKDQRDVWVPFHFLPGNEGDTFEERMVCQIDSPLARKMVEDHLRCSAKPFAVELMGVAAHVYADTFSHYGFSGISSDLNYVDAASIRFGETTPQTMDDFQQGWAHFVERFQAGLADKLSRGLGHGGAYTYPDKPFLRWEFEYEKSGKHSGSRNNLHTFIDAAEKIHEMFVRFVSLRPELENEFRSFEDIREAVHSILLFEGDTQQRCEKWKAASLAGAFVAGGEEIPAYEGEAWLEQRKHFGDTHSEGSALPGEDFYRFYQAVAYHRVYVQRELLPEYSLVIA